MIRVLTMAALAALGFVGTARATVFSISYTAPGIATSGIITATPVAGGNFVSTSLTGNRNGVAISLLPVQSYAANDNDVFGIAPYFSYGGLSFMAGGVDYNLSYGPVGNTTGYAEASDATGITGSDGIQVALVLVQIPEPVSAALFAAGLLGVSLVRVRPRR